MPVHYFIIFIMRFERLSLQFWVAQNWPTFSIIFSTLCENGQKFFTILPTFPKYLHIQDFFNYTYWLYSIQYRLFPFKLIQFLTFRLFLFSQKFYLTTFLFILRLSFSFEFFVTLQFVPNTYTETFSSPNKFYYPIHNTMFTYHSTHKVNMKK